MTFYLTQLDDMPVNEWVESQTMEDAVNAALRSHADTWTVFRCDTEEDKAFMAVDVTEDAVAAANARIKGKPWLPQVELPYAAE